MKFFLIVFLALSSLLAQNSTPLPTSQHFSDYEKIAIPFDIKKFKIAWRQRIETFRTQGVIPLTDIGSSFNPGKFNLIDYAKMMDEYGVALIAFSPEIGDNAYEHDAKIWCHLAQVRYSNRAKLYHPLMCEVCWSVILTSILTLHLAICTPCTNQA